jgi:hypothetical protein
MSSSCKLCNDFLVMAYDSIYCPNQEPYIVLETSTYASTNHSQKECDLVDIISCGFFNTWTKICGFIHYNV